MLRVEKVSKINKRDTPYIRQVRVQANVKCVTIENYERADFVVWKGIKLENHVSDYDNLSEIKDAYIDDIIMNLNGYLPEIRVNDFDLFERG